MKIYKITEASGYLGVSINTIKTLANNGKISPFKTSGSHRGFRQDDLDAVEKRHGDNRHGVRYRELVDLFCGEGE